MLRGPARPVKVPGRSSPRLPRDKDREKCRRNDRTAPLDTIRCRRSAPAVPDLGRVESFKVARSTRVRDTSRATPLTGEPCGGYVTRNRSELVHFCCRALPAVRPDRVSKAGACAQSGVVRPQGGARGVWCAPPRPRLGGTPTTAFGVGGTRRSRGGGWGHLPGRQAQGERAQRAAPTTDNAVGAPPGRSSGGGTAQAKPWGRVRARRRGTGGTCQTRPWRPHRHSTASSQGLWTTSWTGVLRGRRVGIGGINPLSHLR